MNFFHQCIIEQRLIFIRNDFQHFFTSYIKNKSVPSLMRFKIFLFCLEIVGKFLQSCSTLHHCSQFRIVHYPVKFSNLKLLSIKKPLTTPLLLTKILFFKRTFSMTRTWCAFSFASNEL